MKRIFLGVVLSFYAKSAMAQSSCERSCSTECKRLAESIINNCGGGNPTPTPPPPVSQKVILHHSDSCSNSVIANLRSSADCSILSQSDRTWAVSIQGVCQDISDMDSDDACVKYKAAASSYATFLYHSDSCAGDFISVVDDYTDCQAQARIDNDRVWAIKVDGQCIDISDEDFILACEKAKNGIMNSSLRFKRK